jgi:hypothetical protein
MSDAPKDKQATPDVRIDRLVLDIPGFDPAQAHSLALQVADGLEKSGAKGEHATVNVSLAQAHAAPADLAARIVAALIERLA